jgi:hypothetical protein
MCVVAVLSIATALLAFSFVPPEEVKRWVDATSPDGNARQFPLERVKGMLDRARALGLTYLGAGLALGAWFREVCRWIGALGAATRRLLSTWMSALGAFLTTERSHALALSLISLVALALRVRFLGQDMRADESMTALQFAARPLAYGLSDYMAPNNHLFNTLCVHVCIALFGDSPESMRLPALVFGTLLVPATYGAVRSIANKHAALLAATLVTCSPYLIHYSANARGYTFVALVFMLLVSLTAWLQRESNLAAWTLAAMLSALGFFAIPTMLYPFGICLTWLALDALSMRSKPVVVTRGRQLLALGSATIVLATILYTPVLVVSGPASVVANEFVVPTAIPVLLKQLGRRTADVANGAILSAPILAVALLVPGLLLSLVWHRAVSRQRVPILLAALLWCGFVLVAQRAAPFGRVWTFLLPLLLGASAIGVVELGRRVATDRMSSERATAVASAVFVVLVGGPWVVNLLRTGSPGSFSDSGRCADAPAAAQFAKLHLSRKERILTTLPARPILAYYARAVGLPDEMTSTEPGGRPYTMVLADRPIAELNESLVADELPTLVESDLELVQQFSDTRLYRIDPPLTDR